MTSFVPSGSSNTDKRSIAAIMRLAAQSHAICNQKPIHQQSHLQVAENQSFALRTPRNMDNLITVAFMLHNAPSHAEVAVVVAERARMIIRNAIR